ncbi:hypothetical protein N657DRAFT_305194 [Parathielavia appendiculata]|uniref:Uncharacterized protein n=1 Tax=Parathielavia appendiculata TaxID=2587402 RepID=A0AAN6Z6G5_9PEZI|nr:hypothetical protein N657DRAFT_305194 [Parathielavia appendiculata]
MASRVEGHTAAGRHRHTAFNHCKQSSGSIRNTRGSPREGERDGNKGRVEFCNLSCITNYVRFVWSRTPPSAEYTDQGRRCLTDNKAVSCVLHAECDADQRSSTSRLNRRGGKRHLERRAGFSVDSRPSMRSVPLDCNWLPRRVHDFDPLSVRVLFGESVSGCQLIRKAGQIRRPLGQLACRHVSVGDLHTRRPEAPACTNSKRWARR